MQHAGTESLAARRAHAALAKVNLLVASSMFSSEGQKKTGVGVGARKDLEPNRGDGGSARIVLIEDHLDQATTALRVMGRGGEGCLDELD